MDFFKFFIFGIAGVSLIFWVAVIALWHTYMFPKIFKKDDLSALSTINEDVNTNDPEPILGSLVNPESLPDRKKYSMKSLVIADFGRLNNLKLDSLYTAVSLGVVFASFTIITYGLHSGFPQI
tara:strand:- start:366 stop:734 length:369 start_codon:yes stop_codon:yes gene_type:complete